MPGDESKSKISTPSQSSVVDNGVVGSIPVAIGKESLRPISELPPVKIPEGVKNIITVEKQPGDQIVVEGVSPKPEVKVETSLSQQAEQTVQKLSPPSVQPPRLRIVSNEELEGKDPDKDSIVSLDRVEKREDEREQWEEAA